MLSNAVNRTVKLVADLIKEVIDINALVADFPELAPGSKASNTSRIASAPAASKSLGKKDSSSANQLRNAMRDLVHQFENILFEYSAQQFMVQQIVWQQEQEHRSRSTSGLNTSIHSFASLLMASTFFEKHGANTLHFFWYKFWVKKTFLFLA